MNSDKRESIEKNYLAELPKTIMCESLGDFLENKVMVSLVISNRIINLSLKEKLKKRHNSILIKGLNILAAKGTKSSKDESLKEIIGGIIKNIESTGALNTSILTIYNSSIDGFSKNNPIVCFYKDAKDLKDDCQHLIPFLMSSLSNYEQFRVLSGIRSDAEIIPPSIATECLFALYYFLEKYKNYSSRLERGYSGIYNTQKLMICFCFERLVELCSLPEEEKLENKQYINSCIRVFTVLLHQQHYINFKSSAGWSKNFWEISDFSPLKRAKSALYEQQDSKNFIKKLEIVDRTEAGMLASLLTYCYLELGWFKSYFYSLDKSAISKIIKNLIKIREGELSTENIALIKAQLVMICKKDKILLNILKEWDTHSRYQFDIRIDNIELDATTKKKELKESVIPESKFKENKDTISTTSSVLAHGFISQQSKPKMSSTEPGLVKRPSLQ